MLIRWTKSIRLWTRSATRPVAARPYCLLELDFPFLPSGVRPRQIKLLESFFFLSTLLLLVFFFGIETRFVTMPLYKVFKNYIRLIIGFILYLLSIGNCQNLGISGQCCFYEVFEVKIFILCFEAQGGLVPWI